MTAAKAPIPPAYTTRTTCRVCGSAKLDDLFSIGEQYVSDFPDEADILTGLKVPITLQLCHDCTLVQAKHTPPSDLLYKRQYWYRSGVTQTMRDALADVARAAIRECMSYSQGKHLSPGDVVLDIGSNDGTLLRCFDERLALVGVEPANNLATKENYKGLTLIHDFWSLEAWLESWRAYHTQKCIGGIELPRHAKVVTALGMFYDLEDPNQFIQDVATILHPEGVFIAQLMCLKNMLAIGDLGNLAHEHLEFYSLKSLMLLYEKAGLEIYDVETNKVNGESYRIYAQHKRGHRWANEARLHKVVTENDGLENMNVYLDLHAKMELNKRKLREFIRNAVADGKRVWVYGASTKGNVLLQYWQLDSTLISGAADRSPEKWGRYTVGTGIKIYSEEDARAAMPDLFLVLPYAFMEEFLVREQASAWRIRGGKFIVPLPEMRVV